MEEEDYIEFAIDYTHNIYSCEHHEPGNYPYALQTITPIRFRGFYARNIDKINNSIYLKSKRNILQIIARRPLNAMQLKKILGYSYPTIHKHLKNLKKLKLITLTEGRSEKGKKEMKVDIHKNVKFIPLIPKDESFILLIRNIMKDSKEGLKEFEEGLDREIQKASKKPTARYTSRNKKQKQRY